ncbi:NADH-quinone oxidoreductase subunit C [Streptoverticillium reticulum]|uniref:NADH-quinone oxidoreductase subunit C n=1 Tax=Streptoverticillium reticulum TaxID=1433415 RepID=UPI0039BF7EB6
MTAVGWLPEAPEELFGAGATAEEAYGLLTVDVPAESWITALETARDRLGCTFFDWLSAVDEPGTGFRVSAHVVGLPGRGTVHRLLVRTTVPHEAPVLPTAIGVYAGAEWHERETHEMFGVDFTGHPHLVPLLLPEGFEGHPLRKDFVLAARVAKAWPGAKEPGEAAEGGPKRRQMLPPGVPDPNEWGPLKGQLPPAPARPARRTAAAGASAEGAAPVRRARSAGEGSASQAAAPARRARSASEGSASQATEGAAAPARRARSASEGSASQAAAAPARRTRSAADGSASQQPTTAEPRPATRPQASDAPWHHARPAFDEPEQPAAATPEPVADAPESAGAPDTAPEPAAGEPAEPRTPNRPAAGEPAEPTAPAAAPASEPAQDEPTAGEPDDNRREDAPAGGSATAPGPAAGDPATAPEPRTSGEPPEPGTPDRPAAGEPAAAEQPAAGEPVKPSAPIRPAAGDPATAPEPSTPDQPAAGEPVGNPPERDPESDPGPAAGEPGTDGTRQHNPAGGDTV